jgi:hypothetical protein
MLFGSQSNPKEISNMKVIDVIVSFWLKEVMFLVTESRKEVQAYRFLLTEDEGVSLSGQVEFIDKKITPHEVHYREGIYRRNVFVSAVSEDCSEAGAGVHQEKSKPKKRVIVIFDDFQNGEAIFESFNRDNVLIEVEVLLCIKIECKKGMSFEAVMPISNKYLIKSVRDYKLSTKGSVEFSVYIRRFSNSSILQNIDQRHECVGNRAPSSSEDG